MFQPSSFANVFRLESHHRVAIGSKKTRGSRLSRRRAKPPVLESLESRAMLSTIVVSSTGDTGNGTLRAAIEQANLDAAQDTITFAPSVAGTITLSTALPDLSAGMNIVGPGPSSLTVADGGFSGIFTVSPGARVAISGLTITGGFSGAKIDNFGARNDRQRRNRRQLRRLRRDR